MSATVRPLAPVAKILLVFNGKGEQRVGTKIPAEMFAPPS